MRRLLTGLASALLLAGCGSRSPTGAVITAAVRGDLPAAGAAGATFMTRNIYVGGRLEIVTGETDPTQIPIDVARVFAEIQVTDFATRAKGLADEIAATRPAVMGIQEVSHIYLDGTEIYDYLALLQAELAARGLHYTAIEQHTTDVTLPMLVLDFSTDPPTPVLDQNGQPQLRQARLVDGDALLIADGVPFADPTMAHYDSLADLLGSAKIVRGWIAADVTVAGRALHVVNTHLESENPPVSGAQAAELLALVAGATRPTVLLGDFNSGPGADRTAYDALVGGGFVDTWVEKNKDKPGVTCCQTETLLNPASVLNQRVDLVLAREPRPTGNSGLVGGLQVAIVGDMPANRVLAPAVPALGLPARLLWPSDHAGYVVTLRLPNAGAE
jgi:endonuclease/exonuclease/phosphatase family metal-dependent hydrolase